MKPNPKTYADIQTDEYEEVSTEIIEQWRFGTLKETRVAQMPSGTLWAYRWRYQTEEGMVEEPEDIAVFEVEAFQKTITAYRKVVTEPSSGLPTYHDLLNLFCSSFGIPGSPSFESAINWVKQDVDKLGEIKQLVDLYDKSNDQFEGNFFVSKIQDVLARKKDYANF